MEDLEITHKNPGRPKLSTRNGGEEYQLVGFTINSQEFGVDISQIREIIREVKITKLPNSPDFVEGVVNLRGNVTPVVDLRRRFRMEQKDRNEDSRIIITELAQGVVGFMVDNVTEVRRVTESIIEAPPPTAVRSDSYYVSGIAKLEEGLLIILDLEKVLSAQEIEAMTQLELTADEQSL